MKTMLFRLRAVLRAVFPPGNGLLVLLLLVCQFFTFTPSAHALDRYDIRLDGPWRFLPRLGDRGEGGRFRFEAPDAIRSTWRTIEVPSCFQRQFEDLKYFEGVSWYARTFEFYEDPDLVRARLVFEGVNYLCRVYLNGQVLGDHEGGYTSFSFPATEALVRGSNTLAVQVDNRRHLLKVPGDVGWFNYGGIYRPVRIEVRPEIHLADIHVRTKTVNPAAVLSVKVRVEGPASFLPGTATVRIDLLDREMGLPVASSSRSFYWTGQEELSTFELRINRKFARLWSPEDPYLYKLRTRLTFEEQQLDQTFTKIGIRTISVSGRDFLLNGEPCPVRGICYFPDFEKTGLTLDGKAFARDLANFRELGINAIRSHFLLERRMLDACDSLGLLVWHDIPVYWVRDYDRYTLMLAREIAREMAASDRNRPCMAVWSLGNENDMRDTDRTSFFTALRDEVKRCVPDAVISLASYLDNWANVEKYVDVMCVNIYPGWYNFLNHDPIMWHAKPEMLEKDIARFAGLFRKSIESNSPMPLWVGEIGGGAAFGMYKDDPWRLFSEDYQATLVKKQLELIESIPEISGLFLHRYNDYNDPSRMEVPGQNGRNLKGIVTIDGKRKKAFEVLKAFYRRWKR